jgi:uncharacterized protein
MIDDFEEFMPDPIGAGYAYPVMPSVQGGVRLSSAEINLEQSIIIILRTGLGERVYRPDFGSRLAELAFEPLNVQTLLMIRMYVEEAIESWEPRVDLMEVRTDPDPIRGKVDIEIVYRPRESSDSRSFVYPFYLLSTRNNA